MNFEPLIDVRHIPMSELIKMPAPPCLTRLLVSAQEKFITGFSSALTGPEPPAPQ